MTIEEQIEDVLMVRLGQLTLTPSLSIAWPNRPFTPTVGTSYLRVRHLRNDNDRLFLKGSAPHHRQGILQVDVVAPLDAGAEDANAIAGAVAGHFPADLDLYGDDVRVKIEAAPTVHGAIPADAWWETPVSIGYRCFV